MELPEEFPLTFRNAYVDYVDEGWLQIMREGCALIEAILKEDPTIPFQIMDIKEKFGTLRFYYIGGNEQIDEIADRMMELTSSACQRCGKPGTLYTRGWMYVACPDHVNKKDILHDEQP